MEHCPLPDPDREKVELRRERKRRDQERVARRVRDEVMTRRIRRLQADPSSISDSGMFDDRPSNDRTAVIAAVILCLVIALGGVAFLFRFLTTTLH